MKSIDKLKRLTGEATAPPQAEPAKPVCAASKKQEQLGDLRRRIETVVARAAERSRTAQEEARRRGDRGLRDLLEGEEVENDYGRFFLKSASLSGASRHGYRNLREISDPDMTAAGTLADDPSIGKCRFSDALFLDTETTGLSGGTGTMAFLIGLGWFEKGDFQVRQILARDFGEEAAALACLADIARQKKFLITFNGKAFDVNLLAARFILNRLPDALAELPHLDLLHPARRLLGHRLDNCRLATLEADILGVRREGDIPGWEIPQRYFDWLRRRDPRLLYNIFEHNRLDVVSMASLTAHLADILTAQTLRQHAHPDDYLAAAGLLLKRTHPAGAQKILDLFREDACSEFSLTSKKKLAQLYKRTGRLEDAAGLWRQMADCGAAGFYPVSELAKYLEHRAKRAAEAAALVENALAAGAFSEKEKESLEHRLKRLLRKAI